MCRVADETFEADAREVLSTLHPQTREVAGTKDESWFLRRCAGPADRRVGATRPFGPRSHGRQPSGRGAQRVGGLALALAFHELATNAVKYGALSADSGCVEITGRRVGAGDGPSWTLVWRERGGPEVRVPDRTGFGNELITACVRQDLRGTVSFDFAPEGLTVEITAPMG